MAVTSKQPNLVVFFHTYETHLILKRNMHFLTLHLSWVAWIWSFRKDIFEILYWQLSQNMKKNLMSFNMCQLKIHIVTDSISSIYSFMNRVFMPSYSTFNGRYIIAFIASLFNFYNEIFITLWTKPNIVPRSTMMETFMLFRSFKVLLIFYSTLKSSHFRPNVFLTSELDAILQD